MIIAKTFVLSWVGPITLVKVIPEPSCGLHGAGKKLLQFKIAPKKAWDTCHILYIHRTNSPIWPHWPLGPVFPKIELTDWLTHKTHRGLNPFGWSVITLHGITFASVASWLRTSVSLVLSAWKVVFASAAISWGSRSFYSVSFILLNKYWLSGGSENERYSGCSNCIQCYTSQRITAKHWLNIQ